MRTIFSFSITITQRTRRRLITDKKISKYQTTPKLYKLIIYVVFLLLFLSWPVGSSSTFSFWFFLRFSNNKCRCIEIVHAVMDASYSTQCIIITFVHDVLILPINQSISYNTHFIIEINGQTIKFQRSLFFESECPLNYSNSNTDWMCGKGFIFISLFIIAYYYIIWDVDGFGLFLFTSL